MKSWSPERQAAQKALQEAVEAYVNAFRDPEDNDGVLTDWAMACALVRYNDEGQRESIVWQAFQDGSMETHKAIGLYYEAIHNIQFGHHESE